MRPMPALRSGRLGDGTVTFYLTAVWLKALQPRLGIAELFQLHSEAIHKRQVQATHLAVVFTLIQVVEGSTGFKCSAKSSRKHKRQSEVVVLSSNPHVGEEHEARV